MVEDLAEKKAYLDRVVALEPGNASAKATLALLEKKTADHRPFVPAQDRQPTAAGLVQEGGSTEETGPLYCYQHPKVETGLRCNRCNRPICPKCAQRTPWDFAARTVCRRLRIAITARFRATISTLMSIRRPSHSLPTS
ncbi:MAG: hypothetical protein HC875_25880 [Anaerolineales bacterium]|nr:hypothetical protein [Anaerolineales bacterium]